jgi:thermitase
VGLALAGLCLFAGLIQVLPEPRPPEQASTATPVIAALHAEPAPADRDAHGHDDGACEEADGCGLDAKAMLAAFKKAIEDKGAVHRTYGYDAGGALPVLAVAQRVNVGLAADADASALAGRHGLTVVRELPSMGQALLRLPAEADLQSTLAALSAERGVRYAEPDYAARVALTPNDPFLPLMQGRRNAALERAWDLTTGAANMVVAVLDTGADPTHPDLQNRLVPGFDFVNNTATTSDDNGHGTAMAGIIAAEGMNNEGVVGVAFNSRVMPIKVADAQGVASISDVAAGIDYAIANGARVINLSMGARIGTQALRDAVNRALQAGVVVVASAGNDPVHHEMYPAAYDGVVSCTALGENGELGFEAVVATGVEAGSPAEDLITTLPGGVYGFVSGSSAAAAYASGVAALVASRAPNLSGADIARILRVARDPIAALSNLDTLFRFGRLNARLAVERASSSYIDVAVTDLRFYPAKPIAGQPTTAIMEVTNEGQATINNLPVRLQYTLPSGARIEIGFVVANGLLPGEVRQFTLTPCARSPARRAAASRPSSPTTSAT